MLLLLIGSGISPLSVTAEATHSEHNLTYEASDNVLYQRCSDDGCSHLATAAINSKNEEYVYTGRNLMPCTVEFSGEWIGNKPIIYYENNKYVGEALCKITQGDVSAVYNFTIVKKEIELKAQLQHIGAEEQLQTDKYTLSGLNDVDHISTMEMIKNDDGTITPVPTIKDSEGNDVTSNYFFNEEEALGEWHIHSALIEKDTSHHWYTCDKCPGEKIFKKNHSFSSWETTVPATHDTQGERRRECSCGYEQTEIINPTAEFTSNNPSVRAPIIISAAVILLAGASVGAVVFVKKRKSVCRTDDESDGQ